MGFSPEFSRRARSIPAWAAIRALGRRGVTEMIESSCASARAIADGPRRAAGLHDPQRRRPQPGPASASRTTSGRPPSSRRCSGRARRGWARPSGTAAPRSASRSRAGARTRTTSTARSRRSNGQRYGALDCVRYQRYLAFIRPCRPEVSEMSDEPETFNDPLPPPFPPHHGMQRDVLFIRRDAEPEARAACASTRTSCCGACPARRRCATAPPQVAARSRMPST